MTDWNRQQQMIADAIQPFPQFFGLRAFPGDVFTISRASSYVNDAGEVQLYTFVKRGGEWLVFAKGTPTELLAEMIKLDS